MKMTHNKAVLAPVAGTAHCVVRPKPWRYVAWPGIMLRAISYFGIVFFVGFILGAVRVTWLVPQVGERSAELLEAPLMLVAMFSSARFITRRFPALSQLGLIASGVLALVVLLFVEFSVVLGLRGLSISQYLAERDPIAGSVYVVMLVLFAAMPWIVGRKHIAT